MWKLVPEITIYPGTGNSTQNNYGYHKNTHTYLRKQGSGAGACHSPSKAKCYTAEDLAPIEFFWMKMEI